MKKFSLCLIFCLFCRLGFAENIYLKDGRMIQGSIIERTAFYYVVSTDGVETKYFNNQIDRIEASTVTSASGSVTIDAAQIPSVSQQKVELIVRFMEINGTIGNLKNSFERTLAQAPEDKREMMTTLLNLNDIVQLLIPIYDKYYTEEDLRQLIDFYQSPVGQKVFDVTPQIMKETLEASINYFKDKQIE